MLNYSVITHTHTHTHTHTNTHSFPVMCAAVTCSLYTHVFVRPFFVDLYLFSGAILSLSGTTSELEVQPSRTLALIGHAVRGAQSHT